MKANTTIFSAESSSRTCTREALETCKTMAEVTYCYCKQSLCNNPSRLLGATPNPDDDEENDDDDINGMYDDSEGSGDYEDYVYEVTEPTPTVRDELELEIEDVGRVDIQETWETSKNGDIDFEEEIEIRRNNQNRNKPPVVRKENEKVASGAVRGSLPSAAVSSVLILAVISYVGARG